MALRDVFSLPFGRDPGRDGQSPVDGMLGHTPPLPSPEDAPMPTAGAIPIGGSGRANFWGLPQWDELNRELIGSEGLRRFNEMYRTDAHCRRLILAAWSPLVAATWTLEPFGGDDATDQDRQIADDIWWLLNEWMAPNFVEHLYELGPLLLRSGFAPFETVWDTVERNGKKLLAPRSLQARLPISVWRWWQDDFGQLTHIGQILPSRADVIIPATELLYYRIGAEGDNWMGTSLLRHAYKHWYIKDKLERIDMVGQERKAVGVPVVYPPQNATSAQKAQLERVLQRMHMSESVYMMMPGPKAGTIKDSAGQDEWLLEIEHFDSSAGGDILKSIEYHHMAMLGSFLLDFLELGHHQVGARATAEVQEDPFLTAVNGALLPPVVPPFNRLIDRIRRLNWEGAEGSPTLKPTLNDEASLSEIAQYIAPLVQNEVIQVDPELEDWVRDRAGMPRANAEIREQRSQAREAGFEAAQQAATAPAGDGNEPPQGGQPAKPSPKPPAPKPSQPAKPDAGKQLDQPSPPPNLRVSTDEAERCATCKMFFNGECGGYWNQSVRSNWVCDSWVKGQEGDADPDDDGDDDRDPVGDTDDDAAPKKLSRAERRREHGRQLEAENDRKLAQIDAEMDPLIAEQTHPKILDAPVAAGVAVHAADTSRVLIARRAPDDTDQPDVFGKWEFPGGKIDPDDASPWHGALREFGEETNGTLPAGTESLGSIDSPDGAYRLHVMQIPRESDMTLGHPDKGETSELSWQHPRMLREGSTSPRMRALLPALTAKLGTTTLDSATAEPTAKWFEALLSRHELQQAFDGARDHIEAACKQPALTLADQMANQAAGNPTPTTTSEPPSELVDSLTRHYEDMYRLGAQTVAIELERQRRALKRTLDDAANTDAALTAGSRLARARKRGEHSARNILGAIRERLGRDQITGLKDPAALQAGARQAALAQLRKEALTNTAVSVNDGRNDQAASATDVIGAMYTACMDERSCDPCVAADNGVMLSPEAAIALGPPNPDCQGGDFCRCTLVWLLSDDPAALAAAAA